MIVHWDEVEGRRRKRGHVAATWYPLTGGQSSTVGVQRIVVDPERWSTPLHVEGSGEEIFYVLSGSGVSVQGDDETIEAFAVGPGDCLVHVALEHAHTLKAGPGGLDALAFGERHYPVGSSRLPRARMAWGLGSWVPQGSPDDHPWKREAEAGPPDVPPLSPRPTRIVNVVDAERLERSSTTISRGVRDLGRSAGSRRTGLRVYDVASGMLQNPPHCHSAEEEIFVVLDGEGTASLWPHARFGGEVEEHPLRAGHTIARPAGSGRPHSFRAGDGGMTLLAYGTRDPNDVTYYPRSKKVNFRGVGVIGRIEQLDYEDGED